MISKNLSKGPISQSGKKFFGTAIHTPICIIGGGTGGLNVAGQLSRQEGVLKHHIRIFEPNRFHHYQPGWTMVGGGLLEPSKAVRYTHKLVPKGIALTSLSVVSIDPEKNLIVTEDGQEYTYEQLVVAAGIVMDWAKIPGLLEAIQEPTYPVGSIYDYNFAQKVRNLREGFPGGRAVFTQPLQPMKCAGAPQKIMHLCWDTWKQKRVNAEIQFYTSTPAMFIVPKYAAMLQQLADERKIKTHLQHHLEKVDGRSRIATFKDAKSGNSVEVKFDFLHAVPPQTTPAWLKKTKIVNETGFVNVDSNTLQHVKYKNIWSLGDCSSLPTSRTAAAITGQTPVLVNNLLTVWRDKAKNPQFAQYYGYTSCPILIGENNLLLAEFNYKNEPEETLGALGLQDKPRTMFYLLTRYGFLFAYFNLLPRGLWYGRSLVLPPVLKKAPPKA